MANAPWRGNAFAVGPQALDDHFRNSLGNFKASDGLSFGANQGPFVPHPRPSQADQVPAFSQSATQVPLDLKALWDEGPAHLSSAGPGTVPAAQSSQSFLGSGSVDDAFLPQANGPGAPAADRRKPGGNVYGVHDGPSLRPLQSPGDTLAGDRWPSNQVPAMQAAEGDRWPSNQVPAMQAAAGPVNEAARSGLPVLRLAPGVSPALGFLGVPGASVWAPGDARTSAAPDRDDDGGWTGWQALAAQRQHQQPQNGEFWGRQGQPASLSWAGPLGHEAPIWGAPPPAPGDGRVPSHPTWDAAPLHAASAATAPGQGVASGAGPLPVLGWDSAPGAAKDGPAAGQPMGVHGQGPVPGPWGAPFVGPTGTGQHVALAGTPLEASELERELLQQLSDLNIAQGGATPEGACLGRVSPMVPPGFAGPDLQQEALAPPGGPHMAALHQVGASPGKERFNGVLNRISNGPQNHRMQDGSPLRHRAPGPLGAAGPVGGPGPGMGPGPLPGMGPGPVAGPGPVGFLGERHVGYASPSRMQLGQEDFSRQDRQGNRGPRQQESLHSARSGSPVVPPQPHTPQLRVDLNKFNSGLLSLFASLLPTPDEERRRDTLLDKLKGLTKASYAQSQLYLYGSCANSFGVRGSDIDVCLAIDGPDVSRVEVITRMSTVLRGQGMENVQALTHARVPIVKFYDPSLDVACDMCVNNLVAVSNTRLLKDYARIDPRLRQLAFLVKHWAKQRRVNETYRGTLSSYAYVLMCIHFLQLRRPPVLPCLQTIQPHTYKKVVGGMVCSYHDCIELLNFNSNANRETVGELLAAFFEYWAFRHDYNRAVISIRTGALLSKEEKEWTRRVGNERHLICIEDPFDTSHDLGRVVDRQSIRVLREEFHRAAKVLRNDWNPLQVLFEPFIPEDQQAPPPHPGQRPNQHPHSHHPPAPPQHAPAGLDLDHHPRHVHGPPFAR